MHPLPVINLNKSFYVEYREGTHSTNLVRHDPMYVNNIMLDDPDTACHRMVWFYYFSIMLTSNEIFQVKHFFNLITIHSLLNSHEIPGTAANNFE